MVTDFAPAREEASSHSSGMGQSDSATKKSTDNPPASGSSSKEAVNSVSHPDVDSGKSSGLHPNSAVKSKAARTHKKVSPPGENNFHVFVWMSQIDSIGISGSTTPRFSSIAEINLKGDLKEMDRFLRHSTSFVENLAYKECSQHSRREVYEFLVKEEAEITGLVEKTDKWHKIYELQVDIANKAELIFSFFLPARFDGSTVGKFWGAIYHLITVRLLFPEYLQVL
jgi:hypothetical protein